MIAPDPMERFSSYDEVLTELDAARRALEISSHPDTERRFSRSRFVRLFRL
jgi:hypothetical protein